MVELLLVWGVNKEYRNVFDYIFLSLVVFGGYVNIIKILLNVGVEINFRIGSKLGIFFLMLVVMNGYIVVVKFLLDMGFDINV